MKSFVFFALLLLNVIATVSKSAAVSPDSLLGVSPQDVKYYKTASEFVNCKDGSKKIRVDQLNDDFCDCPDGSDEPGTSACPRGKFYCKNAGHIPLVLFSSRVNDGICDCCDGSDEYGGKVKCPNTCWEAGKVARDKLQKKIATYQQGVTLRRKEIEQAKLAFAKDEAELTKLKNEEKELKGVVDDLKERKEQIEKAEEKERLEKEKETNKKKEAEEKAIEEVLDGEKTEITKEKPDDHDTHDDNIGNIDQDVEKGYSNPEVVEEDNLEVKESHNDAVDPYAEKEDEELASTLESGTQPDNEEGEVSAEDENLSKEEMGRRVASRWTGENSGQKTGESDASKDNDSPGEIPKDVHDEEYDGYSSEVYDDDERYNDHDSEDHINDDLAEDHGDSSSSYKSDSEDETNLSGSTSWIKKIKTTFGNVLEAVNLFRTPVNISDASRVRKEFDEYSSKLSKMQSKISSLSKKLKHDFGPDKEFYSFYDRCFEGKENKYVYKICPYKQATQNEGHSTTRLGQWEKFEDSYKVMLFSNGDKCWNGPDRSLKVRLRCGLENEIADVDEPSRCEYVAVLSTPNVCHEEKLKELQSKLEKMNNQQPQKHDEL